MMIVLDVSRSMDARDVQPSRMEATKAMLRTTLGRLGGNRVGMVIFGGSARVRFPLTTDLAAASQVVSTIETGPVIVQAGSSASTGLDLALTAFEGGNPDARRVILLITDGDDLGAAPAGAAQRISEAGVELLVVGVGTEAGGTVPVFDSTRNTYRDKLGADGQPIITTLNEPFLRALAAAAGGRYLGASLGTVPGSVAGRLAALERTTFEAEEAKVPIERYQWFAGASLAFLVLGSLVEWLPRPSRRALVGGIAVAASLLAGCAARAYELNEEGREALERGDTDGAIAQFLEAQAESPDDPRIRLNLAAAYHAAGRYEEASIIARTLLLESDPDTRAKAHASIGHHQFAAGSLLPALDEFREALLDNPNDKNSRHDYEVILRLLTPQTPANGEPQNPGGAPSPTPPNDPGEDPTGTPGPGQTPQPGEEPGSQRPGSAQEVERRLADLDAEIARLLEEAGEEPDAAEALQILQLIAERQRVASLRDALSGSNDPRDY
jgi:tetratricopeptide (TPR) repeat protein